MKTKWIILVLVAVSLLAACTPSAPLETDSVELPSPEPSQVASLPDQVLPTPAAADYYGLAYMREEEKLARDVYQFLYDLWGLQIFQNIAASEQTHTNAVLGLLAAYNLPDPAAQSGYGEFADSHLQELYDQLTLQGSESLSAALQVGAAIEEIDILDLQDYLEGNLPSDIRQVYQNLLSGSCNHLSAFTSTLLRQTGETYTPQYMTPEAYQEALSSSSTGGYGRGNGRRGGG